MTAEHSPSEYWPSDQARALRSAAAAREKLGAEQLRRFALIMMLGPPILAVAKTVWEPLTPVAVVTALALLAGRLFRGLGMAAGQRQIREAALARELHDCRLLALPWNQQVAGREPPVATDAAPAGAGEQPPGWLAEVPVPQARLLYQRDAVAWNGAWAAAYRQRLLTIHPPLWGLLLLAATLLGPGFEGMLTTVVVLSPSIIWLVEETGQTATAGRAADRVRERTRSAWRTALSGALAGEALLRVSRGIQDNLFAFRADRPVPVSALAPGAGDPAGAGDKSVWEMLDEYHAKQRDGLHDGTN